MKLIYKAPSELIPYSNNPRRNDGAVAAVAESIRRFGFKVPIIVDLKGEIVAGHTRLKAAQQLGLDQVPVIIADDLTDDQVRAFRLADNKVGELAQWDAGMLADELQALHELDLGFSMEDFGFVTADQLLGDIVEDGGAVDGLVPEEPISQPGDLWILGRHRVLCGDSTEPASYERLMAGKQAQLVLTDPPYNVNLGGADTPEKAKARNRRTDGLLVSNDNMTDRQFAQFLIDAFQNMERAMADGAAFYIWHADQTRFEFLQAMHAVGLEIRQVLVWVKSHFSMGRQDYHWAHEPCLYGWKDGASHYFIDDRTLWTTFDDYERPKLTSLKKAELVALLDNLFTQRDTGTTILRETKPAASIEHPTMKPIRLMARQILNSTRPGEIVLDPFGGSGSTLIAAEQLGRTCYTIELDPRYTDTIVARWERLTGQKAKRQ